MKFYVDSSLPSDAERVGELILKVANRYYNREVADQVEEHVNSASDNSDTSTDEKTSISSEDENI